MKTQYEEEVLLNLLDNKATRKDKEAFNYNASLLFDFYEKQDMKRLASEICEKRTFAKAVKMYSPIILAMLYAICWSMGDKACVLFILSASSVYFGALFFIAIKKLQKAVEKAEFHRETYPIRKQVCIRQACREYGLAA